MEKTDEFKAIENKKAELQESSARYDKTIEELFKNKDYKKAIASIKQWQRTNYKQGLRKL